MRFSNLISSFGCTVLLVRVTPLIGIDRDSIPVNENGVDFEEISSRMDITR